MKKSKIGKLAALLAAGALLFNGFFMSCAAGDENTGGGTSESNSYESLSDAAIERTAKSESGTIAVTADGTSIYSGSDINEAWAAVKKISSGEVIVSLAAGTYTVTDGSQLSYSGAANIKICGESEVDYGTDVLIEGNPGTNSQKSRELVYLTSSSTGSITLEYVTLLNNFAFTSKSDVQAETIATDGTGNLAAYNCSFLSGQDTIRTVAKAWFYKCYIEGDVDFLWMETSGTVALYEECVIRAINDRVSAAYFTAPRMNIQSKAGKGLVIFNSALQAESGLDVYLGRNPWASSALSSFYNNVAIVDSKLYLGENSSLNSKVWKGNCNGTSNNQYVGFKTDDYYSASSSGIGAVLSSSVESAEYCGRKNILNRIYNTASHKFQKDSDNEWDIDSVISDNGWTVTDDSSSALLDGETELESTVYDLSDPASTYTDLTISGFSHHSSGSVVSGASGSSITLPITGPCTVYVTGFYAGYGTITAGTQGYAIYDFNNSSTQATVEKAYVVYNTSATSVVVTASSTSYITKIVVEYDDSLSYTPVTSIAVSSDSDSFTVGVPVQLSAAVLPNSATNADVIWSSSDESVGTIDKYTGTATFVSAGSVIFTATACDASGTTGTISCEPAEATWESAEWYDSKDSSSITASGNGTGLGGSAGTNNSVFTIGTTSGVTLGSVKSVELIDGTTASISTGIKMNSNGTVTFSVTKNAKVTVYAGYCSDYNITADTLAIEASNGGEATAWSTNPSSAPTADATYVWSITSGTYTICRADSANAPAIYYVRVDIGEYEEEVSDVTLSISDFETSSVTLDLNGTASSTQTTSATASNGSTPTVSYASSSTSIAAVDSSTGEVTAAGIGIATITATASLDGCTSVTASYSVTVKDTSTVDSAYSINFTGVSGVSDIGEYDFGKFSSTNGKYHSSSYGWIWAADGTLTIPVAGSSTITICNSYSKAASKVTVSSSDSTGSFDVSSLSASSGDHKSSPEELTLTYNAGDETSANITFSFGGEIYLSKVIVTEADYSATISSNELLDLRTLLASCSTGGAASSGSEGKVSYKSMYYKNSTYGAYFYNSSTLSFTVGGACTVYVANDQYSRTSLTVSAVNSEGTEIDTSLFSTTTVEKTSATLSGDSLTDENSSSFQYTGTEEATITLSVTGNSGTVYVPAIYVSFD